MARRMWYFLFWVAVVALSLNLGRSWLAKAHAQAAPVPVPYTVTLEQVLITQDGRTTLGMTQQWAIRSDGARASKVVMHTGPAFAQRNLDFPSGKHIVIVESAAKKSTIVNEFGPPTWIRNPANNCVLLPIEHYVGEETVSGYRTAKLVQGTVTRWLALDFGCALVKDIADWGEKGRNETRLVSLTSGEPSVDLFVDPVDFKEVPMSELFKQAK